MEELKVHCLFFSDKICHEGCPNYEKTLKDIFKTAKNLDSNPICVATKMRIDPRMRVWARCHAQLNKKGLTLCLHNPIQ